MKTPKLLVLLSALIVLVLVAAACAEKTETPVVEPTEVVEVVEPTEEIIATEEVVATEVPPTEEVAPEPCAPATEGALAGVDPRGQTVVWWHNHSGSREEGLATLIAEFNSTNECGITVEAQNQGSYDDIRDKMNAGIQTGDLPGLVVGYQNDQAFYALAGGLVDINTYMNDPYWGLTAEEQADFYPAFLEQSVHPAFDNMRLGFPPNRSIEIMYYNQTWLEELGFTGPPTTPDEFRTMACAAAAANGDGTGGYVLRDDASAVAAWTFAFGGDVLNEDGTGYIYNGQATVDAMTFLKGMYDDGCAYFFEGYPNPEFAARRALFTSGSSSGMRNYAEDVATVATEAGREPDVWGIAAIPHTTPDPVINVYGGDVMIPATTPEIQLAAWIFIDWYTTPEIQARWAEISGYFQTRATTSDFLGEYIANNTAYGTQYQQAVELLQFGAFEPQLISYQTVRDSATAAFNAIMQGADVQATLDTLTEEANALQAELMAP
jgi:multiple sugar transport system substrate-binding protein/sn-glycerol 3-phosphate transport system substrate-binding protein